MVQSNKERRQWTRAKRVLSVEYYPDKAVSKKYPPIPQVSLTHDMGIGGLTLYTDQEYRVGEILHIKVVMAGLLDIFSGRAQVVRINKKPNAAHYFIAVKFLHTTPKRSAKRHHIEATILPAGRQAAPAKNKRI